MAVTETTAETDGSLTAVTVAETDCRPTDNENRSKRSMLTEAIEPDYPLSSSQGARDDRRHVGEGCETRKKDGRQCYQVSGRLYQLPEAPPCPPTASNLTARLTVIQFAPILQFRRFRRFGVMFRPKPNLCQCTLAVAETRPKPGRNRMLGQFRRRNRNRNRNRISVRL